MKRCCYRRRQSRRRRQQNRRQMRSIVWINLSQRSAKTWTNQIVFSTKIKNIASCCSWIRDAIANQSRTIPLKCSRVCSATSVSTRWSILFNTWKKRYISTPPSKHWAGHRVTPRTGTIISTTFRHPNFSFHPPPLFPSFGVHPESGDLKTHKKYFWLFHAKNFKKMGPKMRNK